MGREEYRLAGSDAKGARRGSVNMAWIKNEPKPPVRRPGIEPQAIFRKLYRPLGAIAVVFADLAHTGSVQFQVAFRPHRRNAIRW